MPVSLKTTLNVCADIIHCVHANNLHPGLIDSLRWCLGRQICRPWRGKEYRGLLVENGGEGKEEASLTLQGFLAKWAFTTATDPARVLAYARYLGFEGPAAPLFSISKPRRQERKAEQLQRSVVQVVLSAALVHFKYLPT